MNRNATLLLLLLLQTFSLSAQVRYVDLDATAGANDGSSWTDAFVSLQDALLAAEAGDTIWVAEGIYLPGDTTTATFRIDKDLVLLGGFSGMETIEAERNPAAHPTLLSGDLLGNDQPFLANREDNVRTVVTITENITNAMVIDGFILKGGHAVGDDSAFEYRRGGGLFTYGAPLIRQCIFQENFAEADGGGLYLQGPGANGTKIETCSFVENQAGEGGGLMVAFVAAEGATISNSLFFENTTSERGGAMRVLNANVVIDSCLFSGNLTTRQGGAIEITHTVSNLNASILRSAFQENQAYQGGAIRYRSSSGLGAGFNELHLADSYFWKNAAVIIDPDDDNPNGGALDVSIATTTSFNTVNISGCAFEENASDKGSGAARFELAGSDMNFALTRTEFSNNASGTIYPVYINASSIANGIVGIDSCRFTGNTAGSRNSGLVLAGRTAAEIQYRIRHSEFSNNHSEGWGGGLTVLCLEEASVDLQVSDCLFSENSSLEYGAAVGIGNNNGKLTGVFSHCIFQYNSSPNGSALATTLFSEEGNAGGSTLVLDNCLVANNENSDAAVALTDFPGLEVRSCTFGANDSGSFLLDDNSGMTLTNSILHNPGYEEYEGPATAFTSNGGNLVSDESMDALLGSLDKSGQEPYFEGSGPYPYQVQAGSSAIDLGVQTDDTPDFDLAGNARLQGNAIDAGAYESPFTSSFSEKGLFDPTFTLTPNPTSGPVWLQWDERPAGNWDLEVWDAVGRKIFQGSSNAGFDGALPAGSWPDGLYRVRVHLENGWMERAFVKTSL